MIAVTGDLVDGSVRELRSTRAPLARLCVAARHLLRHRQPRVLLRRAGWIDELRRLGLRVLMNEHVVLRARRRARWWWPA